VPSQVLGEALPVEPRDNNLRHCVRSKRSQRPAQVGFQQLLFGLHGFGLQSTRLQRGHCTGFFFRGIHVAPHNRHFSFFGMIVRIIRKPSCCQDDVFRTFPPRRKLFLLTGLAAMVWCALGAHF
jgi:hypothetical protein